MIDKDIDYWLKYGSNINPSIVINNSTYRGQLETQAVMNAICSGFHDPPSICKPLLEDNDLEDDLDTGIYVVYDDGYKVWHVLLICFFSILILLVTLCFYRRYAKRQMKEVMN